MRSLGIWSVELRVLLEGIDILNELAVLKKAGHSYCAISTVSFAQFQDPLHKPFPVPAICPLDSRTTS